MTAPEPAPDVPLAPAQVDTAPIIVVGTLVWVAALVITVVVPALHTGSRDWWPWTCVAGVALGLVGLAYVLRGRGNAAGARRGE